MLLLLPSASPAHLMQLAVRPSECSDASSQARVLSERACLRRAELRHPALLGAKLQRRSGGWTRIKSNKSATSSNNDVVSSRV
jgi:hypothetical protein